MPAQSPVLAWLLLAATLAVYAVVCVWANSEPFPAPPHTWVAFDALTTALLSLATMWCALRPVKTIGSRVAPIGAVAVAALLVAGVIRDPVPFWSKFWAYLPGYGLQVALLLVAFWMLERTKFWRLRYGVSRKWRFSLAQLLVVMTVVALWTTTLRRSPLFGSESWLSFAFVVANVGVAVVTVIAWSADVHWLLRLAAALGFACMLGMLLGLSGRLPWIMPVILGVDLLLQAVVFSIWIGLGAILPRPTTGVPSSPTSPESHHS